jgi:signal transduction histidine kinase
MFEPRTKPNIGLDVVKQIAELHGGSVRAEDNPGGGTVFIVLLPVTVSAAKTDDDTPIEEAVVMEDNE